MVSLVLHLRRTVFGERRDVRNLYVVVGLLLALLISTLTTLERIYEAGVWPEKSLLLVYGGATLVLLAGVLAGVYRAGVLASWVITAAPVFALLTQILREGMVQSNPSLLGVLPVSTTASLLIGIVIGSLTHALGSGLRSLETG